MLEHQESQRSVGQLAVLPGVAPIRARQRQHAHCRAARAAARRRAPRHRAVCPEGYLEREVRARPVPARRSSTLLYPPLPSSAAAVAAAAATAAATTDTVTYAAHHSPAGWRLRCAPSARKGSACMCRSSRAGCSWWRRSPSGARAAPRCDRAMDTIRPQDPPPAPATL